MARAAKEAKEYLNESGDVALLKTKGTAPETRARSHARQTVATLLDDSGPSKEVTEGVKEQVGLVFRLFDTDRNGKIDETELADLLRSLGKRPLKKKIRDVMAAVDTNKDGMISEEELVEYLVNKRKAKLAKKEEKPASPAPAASTSPAASPKRPASPSKGRPLQRRRRKKTRRKRRRKRWPKHLRL